MYYILLHFFPFFFKLCDLVSEPNCSLEISCQSFFELIKNHQGKQSGEKSQITLYIKGNVHQGKIFIHTEKVENFLRQCIIIVFFESVIIFIEKRSCDTFKNHSESLKHKPIPDSFRINKIRCKVF